MTKTIKYKRKFHCDKSIFYDIKWLNKNGFYTSGCCSGIRSEHPNNERDRMYIEFEDLPHNKKYQIIINARNLGFKIKSKNKNVRIESEKENKLEMFDNLIEELKLNKNSLNLRTMGISNRVYDKINKKMYSVQFYDYDIDKTTRMTQAELNTILKIFPYDLLLYRTKHGLHFISFALLHGLRITKSRAIETSKMLGKQDYWTQARDLTLRVSAKWKTKRFSKTYETISKKPRFSRLLKDPNNYIISEKHLEFYFKYMKLPERIYDKYSNCDKRDYELKIYHYKTRD